MARPTDISLLCQRPALAPDSFLNRRQHSYIGRSFTLAEPIANGRLLIIAALYVAGAALAIHEWRQRKLARS